MEKKAYLVGSGIASMASAAFMIRDGNMPGKNIHIFDAAGLKGGSLDGAGTPDKGYVLRGGRMLNFSYVCTYDLLSFIPSLTDPEKTVLDEIELFNEKFRTASKARVIANGEITDVTSMGFSHKDRLDLIEIMLHGEDHLGVKRISDCFQPSFFETNFWYMWCSMFAFEPWHSAVEFKRYLHRFVHEFPRINTLAGVDRTPYNQYDAIVLPLVKWLGEQGVVFEMCTQVTDLEFSPAKFVKRIHHSKGTVTVNENDIVFVTIGSMTAASTLGSMTAAPVLNTQIPVDWALWEKIAQGRPEFGNPSVFDSRIEESKWESFTVTFRDPLFFQLMEEFSGNEAGSGGLVTFKDSNWLMSIVLAHQPHFINQPANIQVCWGYALFPDKVGNYVQKKMSECTGEEIMRELLGHLKFEESILNTCICIPCMMPYITSQFLTRKKGDRPQVIPEGYPNIAFIGQFCEIPDDVVFTVEYSVRAAQTAVYALLNPAKKPVPMYKGDHDPKVLFNAVKTSLK